MNTMKAVILIMMSNVIYSSSAYAYPCKLISHEVIKTDDHLFQFDHAACLSSNNADNIPFLHVKTNSYDHAQQFSDWKQDHNYNTSDFWNLWNDDFSDHPVFTDHNDSMYYGLGFWLPRKYNNEEVDDVVDAEQWVLNHGVQMSLGFGNPNDDSTQVRLDYRWHTKSNVDDGISLQVHVPLN